MAVSLRPCPNCGRPMDSKRKVCVFCQQQGITSAPPPQPAAPTPAVPPQAPAVPPQAQGGIGNASAWPLVCVIAGIYLWLSGGGPFSGLFVPAKPRTVVYRVTGVATQSASLTYENAQGGTEQREVDLPWTLSASMQPGAWAYISAQNQEDRGSVTAEIVVDGKVWKSSTSEGAYTIATASDRVPEAEP